MSENLYCITHEAWTNPQLFDYLPKECVFVSCLPPELEENWQDNLVEPSPAEWQIINSNARELELSL